MTKLITVTCPDCNGAGLLHARDHHRGIWQDSVRSCQSCKCAGEISIEFVVCEYCEEPICCGECVGAAPVTSTAVAWNGGTVDAPGFTTDTFGRGVAKARGAGYLQMVPLRGAVRVDTGKAGGVYIVTRTSCTCRGHRGHGHCYHRAAAIFVNDVCGYDICRTMMLGFDEAGQPVSWAERQHQIREERIARRKARIAA